MSAPAVDIAPPSPTTAAETGIARSVRPVPANTGSKHGAANFSPRPTPMSSSLCLSNWRPWLCRTKRSSMICYSVPVQKLSSRSPAIPDVSGPRSASSVCCIPGTRSCSFIPMFTVSSLPAGSRSTILDGFHPTLASFFPARCCGARFRGKFVAGLKSAFQHQQLHFAGDLAPIAQPKIFASWLRPLFRKNWVVYCKPPFGGPEYVLQYLGRYTHRVAISNHRLISLADDQVTFRWRDSAHHNEQKVMSLSLDEFLRRFLLHLLPKGFVRIRHFGFLANRRRATLLPLCRQALGAVPPQTQPEASTPGTRPLWLCPNCGGPMVVIERLTAAQLQLRSPPRLLTTAT